MSKERSIPRRLSGGEALDSLMHRIYERLRVHGHFHSHKAYQGYRAKVTVEFVPAMSFSPPLTDEFSIDEMDEDSSPGVPMTEVIEIPVAPPNRVREECGMDMPVQVEENGILVEKWIKPSRYKGKLKPKGIPQKANMGVPSVPGINPIDPDTANEY